MGSVNADLVVRVDRLPVPGETRLARDAVTLPGGKGANQAVAAARSGAPTRFVGAVGTDAHGGELLASLVEDGVDTRHVHRANGPSGLAVIQVDEAGANTILVVPGANAAVSREVVEAAMDGGALDGCGAVLAQLEIDVDAVQAAFDRARAAGLVTILNAAPGRALPEGLVAVTDVLVVNETELLAAAGLGSAGVADDALVALACIVPTVVLTLGADGTRVVDASGDTHLPALPVEVVDTVGAGDAFCGVLAASMAAGAAIGDAVVRANAAGALATTVRGARSAPTATMLAELLTRRDAAPR